MKKYFSALLCLVLLLSACFSFAENAAETTDVVFPDLSGICSEELSAEATRLYNDFYLDASWPVLLYGTDDPSLLPVSGKHAFVVRSGLFRRRHRGKQSRPPHRGRTHEILAHKALRHRRLKNPDR